MSWLSSKIKQIGNAVGDVAKVGISVAAAPFVASAALVSGKSVGDAVSSLPGSKSEATKVGLAAAAVAGGAIYLAPSAGGAVAAETVAGNAGAVFGATESGAAVGGAAGAQIASNAIPALAMDAAVVAPAASGVGALETLTGGMTLTKGTLSTVSAIAGAANAVESAAKSAASTAQNYDIAVKNANQKQNDIFLVAAISIAAAILM